MSFEQQYDLMAAEHHIKAALGCLNVETDSPGRVDTPMRVARLWANFAGEFSLDTAVELLCRRFPAPMVLVENQTPLIGTQTVKVRDIPFSSWCEHHLLPFFGTADIAYTPFVDGKEKDAVVYGLSKLPRLVQYCASFPCTQEELTARIVAALVRASNSKSSGRVYMRASHTCMCCRGVKALGSATETDMTFSP